MHVHGILLYQKKYLRREGDAPWGGGFHLPPDIDYLVNKNRKLDLIL